MEENERLTEVDRIIQESIRPVINADGGDITLVDVNDDGVVHITIEKTTVPITFSSFLMTFKVRKGCSCGMCKIPNVAVAEGVLKRLQEELPYITEVVIVKNA